MNNLGQSLWLDNIPRETLDDGTLRRYIDELSVTGLTSNPTIVDEAISSTDGYDDGIRDKAKAGKSGESAVRGAGAGRPAAIAAAWRRNWEQVIRFFAYPREVRGDRVVIVKRLPRASTIHSAAD